MVGISYLMRRGGSYSARVRIPKDLLPLYGGKREIVRALGTNDPAEAKRRLHPIVAAILREFDDLRARSAITTQDFGAAVWDRYTRSLEADDATRASYPAPAEIEAARAAALARMTSGEAPSATPLMVLDASLDAYRLLAARDLDRTARTARLAELKRSLTAGETHLIDHEVADYLDQHKLLAPEGSAERAVLARQIQRAEIEAMQRTLERDQGDYTGTPSDPIVKPAVSGRGPMARPGEGIMEIFNLYAGENPRGIKADTLAQARRDVSTFADFVGPSVPLRAIKRVDVRDWKQALMRYPVKATETKAFAGMSFAQIIKHNATVGKPTLSTRTVNRYLASLSAFCEWAVSNAYLEDQPVTGMSLAKEENAKTLTFTSDQLDTLFKSPLFTGCLGDEWARLHKPGNVRVDDHRFWVPLIMLFSGARPGEIGQLEVTDLREINGTWIFHLTTDGATDKSLKTKNSTRVVPVHSELIRLGLLDYRERMERAEEVRLFPGAVRNERGQMLADLSRQFPRYLTALGIKEGRGFSLYSFRHGMVDALRRAGFLDHDFKFLVGHGGGGMTARYGSLPEGILDQRVRLIEAVRYPGLDLTHLHITKA